MAEKFLRKHRYDETNDVVEIIRHHCYRVGEVPRTLEEKIVQDADRLDAIGALGIIRFLLHTATRCETINEIAEHCRERQSLLSKNMHTESGRHCARTRYEFALQFFARLDKEMLGEL